MDMVDPANWVKSRVTYHYAWTWSDQYGTRRIGIGPFSDAEAGERAFLFWLHEAGYRLPRWWEVSRWTERRLSPVRRKAIAAMEAALKEHEGECKGKP